jgi:hypothetical protein
VAAAVAVVAAIQVAVAAAAVHFLAVAAVAHFPAVAVAAHFQAVAAVAHFQAVAVAAHSQADALVDFPVGVQCQRRSVAIWVSEVVIHLSEVMPVVLPEGRE